MKQKKTQDNEDIFEIENEDYESWLMKLVESRSYFVSERIADMNDKRSIKPLIRLLQEGDKEIKSIAADTLSLMGVKHAIEPMFEVIKEIDDYHDVDNNFVNAIIHLNERKMRSFLKKLLLSEKSEEIKSAVILFSFLEDNSFWHQPAGYKTLIRLLRSKDRRAKIGALLAFEGIFQYTVTEKTYFRKIFDLIQLEFENEDEEVRNLARSIWSMYEEQF